MKPGTLLAVVIFSLVALAHLLRVVMSTQILVENWVVPIWLSYFGVIVPLLVVVLLLRERSAG